MLFGLANSLASFQSYINKILVKKVNVFNIIYLDNMLINKNKKSFVDFV